MSDLPEEIVQFDPKADRNRNQIIIIRVQTWLYRPKSLKESVSYRIFKRFRKSPDQFGRRTHKKTLETLANENDYR